MNKFVNLFKKNKNPEEDTAKLQANVIDFIDEESRQNIYLWSASRLQKERKSYWYHLRIYLIDWMLIKTFFDGITLMVILSVLLTCLVTFLCMQYNISFNFQATIAVSPLVFPLSFLIRGDFQRRERALDLLADFRSSAYSLFLICREWKTKLGVAECVISVLLNKLLQIVVHVREYLQTRSVTKRSFLVQVVYEDISDLTQLIEMYHNQKVAGVVALMARLHITTQTLVSSFEKLRVIRDYRSPRSARSFAKIMMFITPILFSPLFVYMGSSVPSTKSWTPYLFGAVTAFVFGCLQSVQDRLDDPFLGVTYDEINLDDLHTWANESLKHNANRTYTTGRFVVQSPKQNVSKNDEKPNEKEAQNNKDSIVTKKLLENHPYLSALKEASGTTTLTVTKTQEIPGRNRIFFVRNIDENKSQVEIKNNKDKA